nr:MAG TPA: hypothetical protein [Caudoviricetes sp.]
MALKYCYYIHTTILRQLLQQIRHLLVHLKTLS